MKILFAGELWQGATGLSLVRALREIEGTVVDAVSTDDYLPKGVGILGRGVARAFRAPCLLGLQRAILARARSFKPEIFLTCKGWAISGPLVRKIGQAGITTVNYYPDLCPLSHGNRHRLAVGDYDLVISAKRAHLKLWNAEYGYRNRVEFVPHGYDRETHYRPVRPASHKHDIGLVATWRKDYETLVADTAVRLERYGKTVTVRGGGWSSLSGRLPGNVLVYPPVHGSPYIDALRELRVCIAPLTEAFQIGGFLHPGDEDTTRTYELAAANCFFIHQRTAFMQQIYDENSEVPMYSTADELADKIMRFLDDPAAADAFAAAAHRRAVPQYSVTHRARAIHRLILAWRGERR